MTAKLRNPTAIHQAEEATDFMASILEASTEYSIIGQDLDGNILLWNEGARRLYGFKPEEVVGKLNADVLHTPEDAALGKPREMRAAALRDGKWEGNITRVRKNGERFTAHVVITPRRDEAGNVTGFLLISKDISHEPGLAIEIPKTKLFDSAIVGNAQQALDFIVNVLEASTEYSIIGQALDGKILLWNEGARRLYGFEPEEVVGKANANMLHTPQDVQAGVPRLILDAALRKGKWEGRLSRVRKNGELFTAHVVMTPHRDAAGQLLGFLLISQDISAEIRLTEELKAIQFYTRSLIESSIDALMTTDPLGIITDVNQQMEALTGYDRTRLIGSPFKDYFTDPTRAEEGINLVLREGRVKNFELTANSSAGRPTLVSYNGSTFRDAEGKLQGVFAAARDITEHRRVEEALARQSEDLRRSNAELEQFAYVASHDLQEPLRMVSSYVQLLGQRYKGRLDADADEFIGYAVDGANRMKRLISDLLDYSRVGTRGREFARIDCEAVLQQALGNLQLTIEETHANVTHEPLPAVMADGDQLAQLFQNLLSNAIRFHGQAPPQIHIGAKRRDGDWLFAVRDNGIGMEAQYFERIFVIFQRLHSRADYPGTGIGLAICKKIVERHGGRIWVESQPGRGTTFFFTVPASSK